MNFTLCYDFSYCNIKYSNINSLLTKKDGIIKKHL